MTHVSAERSPPRVITALYNAAGRWRIERGVLFGPGRRPAASPGMQHPPTSYHDDQHPLTSSESSDLPRHPGTSFGILRRPRIIRRAGHPSRPPQSASRPPSRPGRFALMRGSAPPVLLVGGPCGCPGALRVRSCCLVALRGQAARKHLIEKFKKHFTYSFP